MSKVIVTNRKAHRDYAILDRIECGIELKGSEVKSLREGKVNLEDSFGRIEKEEIILYNMYIGSYGQASYLVVETTRPRKLLLHKSQIRKLAAQTARKGFTLVPIEARFNQRGLVKVELAVCKGKKLYDKREAIKRRESELEMRRALKNRRR